MTNAIFFCAREKVALYIIKRFVYCAIGFRSDFPSTYRFFSAAAAAAVPCFVLSIKESSLCWARAKSGLSS